MMAEARLLADGIYFGEGPRWRDGRLWFSDFYAHAVKSGVFPGAPQSAAMDPAELAKALR